MSLQGKDEAQTGVDVTEQRAADAAGAFSEEISVDRDDLRGIRHRVLGEARGFRRKEDVTRRIKQAQVRRQYNGESGAEPASIKRVVLNNQ